MSGYVWNGVNGTRTQTWSNKGCKPKKLPLKQIPGAIAAHERAQAASDEIRLVLGPWTAAGELPTHRRIPENGVIHEWRERLDGRQRQTVKRLSREETKPIDVAELRSVVRRRDDYAKRIEAEIAAMIVNLRGTGTPMREIAGALGMTREGAYQFVKRAAA